MKERILISMLMVVLLAGCGKGNMITVVDDEGNSIQVEDKTDEMMKVAKGDIGNDICQEFTPDFIYSVLHKPIVKAEPSPLATVYACDYYTDYREDFYKDEKYNFVGAGGPRISIILDNLSVETQRKGRTAMGLTLETSDKIDMENIVSRREDGSLWQVDLIINPNRYVWMNHLNDAITDDELIILAAAVADKIQGKSKIKMEKNPIDLEKAKEESMGDSQGAMVEQFFSLLGEKKIPEAIALMDADEGTKQAWGVNFNTINSLTVKSCVDDWKEEWTPELQRFKCELEVSVKPEGEQMGWNQGANTRWIMMTKNNGQWQLHELANNP